MATTNDVTDTTDFTGLLDKLEENMCQVVLGKRDVVRHCIVALLTGEHVLLEDVPGVGKTLVGRAIARSISGDFCRLQFTPDLLPSDIVGSTVFNSNTSEFLFQKGPVFSNLVLADEINRAPPRTQSALLEAMGDRQVSVDGKHTHCRRLSWSSQHKTPSNSKAPTACRKANSIVSFYGFQWDIPMKVLNESY